MRNFSPLWAGLITILATYVFLNSRLVRLFQDIPNERSLHRLPIPRIGGLAILTGISWGVGLSIGKLQGMVTIAGGIVLIASISVFDDYKSLPAVFRLFIHFLAACVLLFGDISLPWGMFGIILTIPAVVWMINLYNFMDGMDGFAAGMTFAGFGWIGLAGWLVGQSDYAFVCWSISAAAFGFLVFNFPPARVFMGDAGSATIGFLVAAMSLQGIRLKIFAAWLPLLVFSPFIVDATVTMGRRFWGGEKIWKPHRSHFYQRLVRLGWGHKKTVLAEYALMLTAGSSALLFRDSSEGIVTLLMLIWAGIFAAAMVGVSRLERMNDPNQATK